MKQTRPQVLEVSQLTAEQMDIELLEGYMDMLEGRTKSAESVFSDIRKDYNLWFTMFRGDKLLSYKGLFSNKLIIEVLSYFDFLYKKYVIINIKKNKF